MSHTHRVGFSCWDLINPLFLFISGVSMAFSFEKHLALGRTTSGDVPSHGLAVCNVKFSVIS